MDASPHTAAEPATASPDSLVPPTRSTLSRPTSRRSLRSIPSSLSASDPLFSPASETSGAESTSGYAVYNPVKKRASILGAGGPAAPVASPLSPSSEATYSSSASSTPPFLPVTSPNLPPLISRPSNSVLPTTSGRPYARSVSEAKEQLQKQALKAELQSLGLSPESFGSAIVHKLGALYEDPDLTAISAAIASGKITLLLPAEKAGPASMISAAFLLDHLVLLDPPAPSTSSAPVVQGFATLSGLRGYMTQAELILTSCTSAFSTATEQGQALDFSRAEVQRALRGSTRFSPQPQSALYPSVTLLSSVASLSIPQSRSSLSLPSASATVGRSTTSRLAALFARSPSTHETTETLPPVVPAPAGLFAEDSTIDATHTNESGTARHGATLQLSVVASGKSIRLDEVVAGIAGGVEAQLRESARSVPGVEGEAAVLDHLVAFAARLHPTPSVAVAIPGSSSGSLYTSDIDAISEAFQDALHSSRLDITRNLGTSPSFDSSVAPAPSPALQDFAQLEEQVDASLEELEGILASTLYDRLLSPSQDLQDDENLCSRIAALEVLELDLEHLGLDLGDETGLPGWERENRTARESLEDLTTRVGKELDRLEDAAERTPFAKLSILVDCHALLVDGLSKLPPVPLKKESEGERPSIAGQVTEVEMDDASSRSSSLPPSRPRSPKPVPAAVDGPQTPKVSSQPRLPDLQLGNPSALPSASSAMSSDSSDTAPSAAAPSVPPSVFDSAAASSTSTSSADLILPLLIYSVIRANPPHSISHLNFIQRFRSESLLHGQSSYCLTNFSAVTEFLTNLDVSSLGISSQHLLGVSAAPSPSLAASPSPASLSPPLTRPRAHTTGGLIRNRASEIEGLVGTTSVALAGVVDASFRSIFNGARGAAGAVGGVAPRSLDDVRSVIEGARGRARDSLPFRRSASSRTLGGAAQAPKVVEESTAQREMVDLEPAGPGGTPDVASDAYAAPPSATSASPPPLPPRPTDTAPRSSSPTKRRDDSDTRSVRSISSMLKETSLMRTLGEVREGVTGGGSPAAAGEDRPSLGERLAGLPLPGLGRFGGTGPASPAGSRRPTLVNPVSTIPLPALTLGTPQRFLEVQSAAELKVGELQELLDGYKQLARRVAELEARRDSGQGRIEEEVALV
ncbi:hypothetical protein JCM11641_006127 [Rhodosporidiobolus odoratus]